MGADDGTVDHQILVVAVGNKTSNTRAQTPAWHQRLKCSGAAHPGEEVGFHIALHLHRQGWRHIHVDGLLDRRHAAAHLHFDRNGQ
ncbi:hypothetical protein [Martelella lutilitoris]|uniref:hypothetical protein n=1 Tax=Martelella lutilitoris TaxID=2583532 RepID=UPI001AED2B2B|nr:hypothetical protein [Martelella lutilitoris]